MTLPQVDKAGRPRAAAALRASGLAVSSVQGVRVYDQAKHDVVLRDLDFAAEVGAASVLTLAGARNGRSWDDAMADVVERTITLVPELQARGLRLAIEPMSPIRQDLSFVNLAADVVDIVRQVGDQSVGYVFDTYHLWWQRGIEVLARESATLVALAQVSDQKPVTMRSMDRSMPGDGIIPTAELVRAVTEGGYDGWWELEIVGDDVGEPHHVLRKGARMFEGLCAS